MLSIIQIPQDSSRDTITTSEFESLGVIQQFTRSFAPGNRLGLLIGAGIGGFVPTASYVIVHAEVITSPWMWGLVFAALLFSATSVYQWAQAAFHSGIKGAGFCALTEGVMVLSHTPWLALSALVLLCGINICSCACALQIGRGVDVDEYPPVTPNVTPAVQVKVMQNNVSTAARPSPTDADRRASAARRARDYRARRKRNAASSQTVTTEGK